MAKFTADFETTTDLEDCRVWAFAISEIGDPDNFIYGNNIDDFMEYWENSKHNDKVWFHNLKFDGSFIVSWLYDNGFEFIENKKDRRDRTFTTLITDMGAWYIIEVYFSVKGKRVNKVIFYDSLKILNFSVAQIAKNFDLPISKLEIDYRAKREKGHILTDEEIAYIRNDVEIMSRALDIFFSDDHTKITIGSNALADFKSRCKHFKRLFPLMDLQTDAEIRTSYKGGFTYANPANQNKTLGAGIVFDVNSMYPSIMRNKPMPYGEPIWFDGEYQHDALYPLYVQSITCKFDLKEGKIPSIQIKHSYSFMPNAYLESSNGEYVTLNLCSPDYELFRANYNVDILAFNGGYKFKQISGVFNEYIDYWTKEKIESKKSGNKAKTAIAKLFLNSLYGKFGTNPRGAKKHPVPAETSLKYVLEGVEERKPIYIPVASFITAYGRRYIIESSQAIREYSMKKYGFDAWCYCDTDSIHCLLGQDDVEELSKVMRIDDYELGAWKLESTFVQSKFLRQKCYIEQAADGTINATVAGMPKFLSHLLNFDNFKTGFTTKDFSEEELGGKHKLRYTQTKGGVVLTDTDFTIK